MRERSEIATRADRSFFGNDRMHAPVEHLTKQLDDFATNSAEAERKHIGPEQHHCAHFGIGEGWADSASVTADKVQLELAEFVRWHPDIGELSEAGVDAVDHCIARHDLLNQFARGSNAWRHRPRDCDMLAT